MNVRCLSLILLLLCCAVPLASAGGMAKIYVSPAEASWKTGQTVQVKVMYDNNLNPVAKDISLYFDWNAEMLKYEGTEFKVGNTVKAGLLSSHELNMLFGEFTSGYPKGEYPLAIMTFKVIGPGDTPILIRVARLNDFDGNPATFVTGKGMYSIAGDAVANPGTAVTPKPTTQIPAGVIVVTPATTYTPIPTLPLTTQASLAQPTAYQPVVVATTLPPVQPAQIGGVPNWPVLTPGATIPTPWPTTIETTVPTTVPTTVETTVPTTVPTTIPTTWPTATPPTTAPTARQITLPTADAVVPVGIPVNDTPTVNETVTPSRTLPSPIANGTNVTAEPTAEWPLDENATAEPTLFIVRGTTATVTTVPVINNSSAALAPAAGTGGSILGDAWLLVLAGVVGVGLVAVGIVTMRRKRDDWL